MSRAPRFDVVLREYLVEIFVPHPARGAEASELTRNWKDAATSADLRSVGRSALPQSLRALLATFDDASCQGLDYLTSEPLGDGAFHDSLGSFGNSRKKRLQTFENVLLRYPGRTRERHPIRARDASCEILPPNPHRHLDLMESSIGIGQIAGNIVERSQPYSSSGYAQHYGDRFWFYLDPGPAPVALTVQEGTGTSVLTYQPAWM